MTKNLKKLRFSIHGVPHREQHNSLKSLELAQALGATIAENNIILNIPGVQGFPYWVAKGAHDNKGIVIGFSPAASEIEHFQVYDLSLDNIDTMIYSGFGYSGSDLLMSRSSDAIIFGYGGVGAVHEFLMAFAQGKPIGVLKGEWDTDEILYHILKDNHELDHSRIVFESDPRVLVEKLAKLAQEDQAKEYFID